MATRSLIGIKLNDNITKVIYCHWDGYPEGVGLTLANNYTSPASVTALMELGDLSTLEGTLDKCKAYHRDRNEPWGMVEPRDIASDELVSVMSEYDAEYAYIYNDEFEWDCFPRTGTQIDILSGKVALN